MLDVRLMTAMMIHDGKAGGLGRPAREGDPEFYEAMAAHYDFSKVPAEAPETEKKGGILWLLKLVSPALWLLMPVLVLAAADMAFAQQGGSRALVQDPTGLLAGNQKAKDAVALLNWLLLIAGAVPATIFTIFAGKKFNDQEYGAALGSALGAVIAGIGGYLAFSFM